MESFDAENIVLSHEMMTQNITTENEQTRLKQTNVFQGLAEEINVIDKLN